MAWTTSACLRARPIARDYLAAQHKLVRYNYVFLRRALLRCHLGIIFAIPLCAVAFLTPVIPAELTSILLLALSASLILCAIRSTSTPRTSYALKAGAGVTAQEPVAAPPPAGKPHAAPVLVSVSSPARDKPIIAPLPRRTRFAAEMKERSWADLMARVNHDLRTPLNAVIGFSEVMTLEMFGPLGDERYQDYVHHIRDSATELLKSAEDTLALTALMTSPANRETLCPCGLQSIVDEAWAFLARKAAGRGIELDASIEPHLEVLDEPRVLRQVLVNMLSEGIARAARGERVCLAATAEADLIEVTLTVSRERKRSERKGNSLPICLARTLLEMRGSSLLELDGPSQGWRAVTVFDRALQPDFFMEPARRAPARQANEEMLPLPLFG